VRTPSVHRSESLLPAAWIAGPCHELQLAASCRRATAKPKTRGIQVDCAAPRFQPTASRRFRDAKDRQAIYQRSTMAASQQTLRQQLPDDPSNAPAPKKPPNRHPLAFVRRVDSRRTRPRPPSAHADQKNDTRPARSSIKVGPPDPPTRTLAGHAISTAFARSLAVTSIISDGHTIISACALRGRTHRASGARNYTEDRHLAAPLVRDLGGARFRRGVFPANTTASLPRIGRCRLPVCVFQKPKPHHVLRRNTLCHPATSARPDVLSKPDPPKRSPAPEH